MAESNERQQVWTKRTMLLALDAVRKKLGRMPSWNEHSKNGLPGHGSYVKFFGMDHKCWAGKLKKMLPGLVKFQTEFERRKAADEALDDSRRSNFQSRDDVLVQMEGFRRLFGFLPEEYEWEEFYPYFDIPDEETRKRFFSDTMALQKLIDDNYSRIVGMRQSKGLKPLTYADFGIGEQQTTEEQLDAVSEEATKVLENKPEHEQLKLEPVAEVTQSEPKKIEEMKPKSVADALDGCEVVLTEIPLAETKPTVYADDEQVESIGETEVGQVVEDESDEAEVTKDETTDEGSLGDIAETEIAIPSDEVSRTERVGEMEAIVYIGGEQIEPSQGVSNLDAPVESVIEDGLETETIAEEVKEIVTETVDEGARDIDAKIEVESAAKEQPIEENPEAPEGIVVGSEEQKLEKRFGKLPRFASTDAAVEWYRNICQERGYRLNSSDLVKDPDLPDARTLSSYLGPCSEWKKYVSDLNLADRAECVGLQRHVFLSFSECVKLVRDMMKQNDNEIPTYREITVFLPKGPTPQTLVKKLGPINTWKKYLGTEYGSISDEQQDKEVSALRRRRFASADEAVAWYRQTCIEIGHIIAPKELLTIPDAPTKITLDRYLGPSVDWPGFVDDLGLPEAVPREGQVGMQYPQTHYIRLVRILYEVCNDIPDIKDIARVLKKGPRYNAFRRQLGPKREWKKYLGHEYDYVDEIDITDISIEGFNEKPAIEELGISQEKFAEEIYPQVLKAENVKVEGEVTISGVDDVESVDDESAKPEIKVETSDDSAAKDEIVQTVDVPKVNVKVPRDGKGTINLTLTINLQISFGE